MLAQSASLLNSAFMVTTIISSFSSVIQLIKTSAINIFSLTLANTFDQFTVKYDWTGSISLLGDCVFYVDFTVLSLRRQSALLFWRFFLSSLFLRGVGHTVVLKFVK